MKTHCQPMIRPYLILNLMLALLILSLCLMNATYARLERENGIQSK